MAYGTLDIDMVAGPSEVLVIADGSANPKFVAADLLSQAEHDKLASAVLLTDSAWSWPGRWTGRSSARPAISAARRSWRPPSGTSAAPSCAGAWTTCAALANEIAPEHLEIVTEDPRALLPAIKNAGAVFLGAWSPEPLGDYLAGPDHVLPTSGTARFFSPLSVDSFLKTMSVIQYDRASLAPIKDEIIALAESGEAHRPRQLHPGAV